MDMYRLLVNLVAVHRPENDYDTIMDQWIRETLREDSQAVPVPVGAWERLRQAISDRKLIKARGMWVLDEPFREPPDAIPATLSGARLRQAQRLYDDRWGINAYRQREPICISLAPGFAVLFNW